jgi:hypothetical protein
MTPDAGGLQIDEDPRFQKKEWLAQRIGLALLGVFVIAAVLGLTGAGGFFSNSAVGDGSVLFVEYERIVRRGAHATIRLHVRSESPEVRFWLSSSYLRQVQIASVFPEPELLSEERGRFSYTVKGLTQDALITLDVAHQTFGRIEAEVGLTGGPSVRFTQWALF